MSARQRLQHVHFSASVNSDSQTDAVLDVLASPKVNCPQGCRGSIHLTAYVAGDSSGPDSFTSTHLSWSIAGECQRGSIMPKGDQTDSVTLKTGSRPHGFCEKCGTTVSLTPENEAAVVTKAGEWVEQHWEHRHYATKHP